ncbi:MJ1255/VC2487 family glycosyltransferase [Vibrio agarivorans]|uniref:Glycosyltransferase family protein n=1 Tax=Vibrio agarivorans TaxID=153622 RepID=A0ABT7Y243_9VIBR|nr:MJ1255/VC2487 family glycosyltransferase [Vibrio agarivorans]MDN2482072.1 glycosyltransferase family protein [Vibrio agarivorans]
MRILYGVQGTGNGHIARARAMSRALKKQNVDVDFLFSGREQDKYFSMSDFGDYQTRKGVSFVSKQGAVDHFETVKRNDLKQLWADINELDVEQYDLVLNDFEPISAWAAKKAKIPCLSISHQNAFRYEVPVRGANLIDKSLIRYFAPADHHLALHWYHFDQPILPPIIQSESDTVESQGYVLVYLPFEGFEEIIDLLVRFSHQEFVCFHPEVKEDMDIENIRCRPLSFENFQQSLHRCNGVIANGGFELPSEALSLGKKLLLKPLNGQFEQLSNVATLEMLGLASSMERLDSMIVGHWLDEQAAEKVCYPDVADAIAGWICEGNLADHSSLQDRLWSQVDFPDYATV